MDSRVTIIKTNTYSYPKTDYFRPSKRYPEYPFDDLETGVNEIYDMVRENLKKLGLNNDSLETDKWNPLGDIIKPGDVVVLKPNWVMDVNPNGQGVECLYTQPSVVAPLVDYVFIALKGEGRIIIGDAPMQECNLDKLLEESGYNRLLSFYKDKIAEAGYEDTLSISLVDFRGLKSSVQDGVHHYETVEDKGIVVDLAGESEFAGETKDFFNNMRITNYDPALLKQHHNEHKNEYYVSKSILDADVIINIPKPKTHRKAGVTIAMKNLVGINARKEYLPHHTNGSLANGGDEYLKPSLLKRLADFFVDKRNYYSQTTGEYKKAKIMQSLYSLFSIASYKLNNDKYSEGSWYGNDTISRTIVDLNKILFYADKNGIMQDEIQRKYLIVADMIISGEKEGPVEPSPKNVGIIASGLNPVCFDEAIATIMGADLSMISTLKHARNTNGKYMLTKSDEEALLVSNDDLWNNKRIEELKGDSILHYVPTSGWMKAFKD